MCVMPASAAESLDTSAYTYEIDVLEEIGVLDGIALDTYRTTDYIVYDDFMRMLKNVICGAETDYDLNSFSRTYGFTKETTTLSKSGYVTYDFAVKTAIKLLGYDAVAEVISVSEYDHIIQANRLGISKGLSSKTGEVLMIGDAVKLVYNTLHERMFELGSIGVSGTGYMQSYEKSDKTVMNRYMDTYLYSGIVTATHFTSMYGESSLSEDEVGIGDNIFRNVSGKSFEDLVGVKAAAYYTDESGVWELVAAVSDRNNKTLTVSAEDISGYNPKTRTLTYFNERGKKTSVVLARTAAVILNNSAVATPAAATFELSDGYVTLTKNGGSGDYDVANIVSYAYVLVDNVYKSGNTTEISNKITFDGYAKITADEDDSLVIFDADGSELELSDISEGNLVSFIYNKDAGRKKIVGVRTDISLEGAVQQMKGSFDRLAVDGTEYELSDFYEKAYKGGEKYAPELSVGSRYIFYLNADGKIVAAKHTGKDEYSYAYLKTAGKAGSGISDTCEVKLFTADGKWAVYTLDDKIIYNYSKSRVKSETVLDSYLGTGSDTLSQMIAYKLNSKGLISEISTAVDESTTDDENVFTKGATESLIYRVGTVDSFSGRMFAEGGASVFMIPDDGDEDHFQIKSVTGLIGTYTYSICGYNGDKFKCYDFFTVKYDYEQYKQDVAERSAFFVISDVQQVMTANGEFRTRAVGVTGFMTQYSMDMIDTLDGSELKCGDVIKFTTDSQGNINYYDKVFDITTKACPTPDDVDDSLYRSLCGTVTDIDYEKYRIKNVNGDVTAYIFSAADAKVIVYSDGGKEPRVYAGGFSDIAEGDLVFSSTNYGYSTDIYVIKH